MRRAESRTGALERISIAEVADPNSANLFNFESKRTLNRSVAEADVLRVRPGKAPQVLRMTAAALLLFSCVRLIQPLASRTVGAILQVANQLKLTGNIVLEVSGGCAKLVRPSVLRFRAALVAQPLTFFNSACALVSFGFGPNIGSRSFAVFFTPRQTPVTDSAEHRTFRTAGRSDPFRRVPVLL